MCTHMFEYSSGFAVMDDQLRARDTKWATPWQWAMNTWAYVWGSTAAFWLYLKPSGVQYYLFHNNNTLYLDITSCLRTGISKIHPGLVTNVGGKCYSDFSPDKEEKVWHRKKNAQVAKESVGKTEEPTVFHFSNTTCWSGYWVFLMCFTEIWSVTHQFTFGMYKLVVFNIFTKQCTKNAIQFHNIVIIPKRNPIHLCGQL